MSEKAQVRVEGVFNAQRFYNTLANIISNKENVQVTVKVTQKRTEEKKQSA